MMSNKLTPVLMKRAFLSDEAYRRCDGFPKKIADRHICFFTDSFLYNSRPLTQPNIGDACE